MALVEYSDFYWFPDGTLATNTPARVFPINSNVLAPIFTDITGGTPLPNPLNTNGAGILNFWAEEGQYWVHIDSETFLVDAGLSEEQADLSTGVASGGNMNISATPAAVDIEPLIGYVVDNTDLVSVRPTVTKVDRPFQTIPLDAGSLARSVTYWRMLANGTVIQQGTKPTPAERRTSLELGVSFYDTGSGILTEVQTIQTILPQPVNQLADLMDALKAFNMEGNVVSAAGPGLMINKTAGVLFSRASNHFTIGDVLTDNPHISDSPAQTPATLRLITQVAATPTPPPVLNLDPANYDVGGVITPVGGGVNTSTIQRVYLFAAEAPSARIAITYGQQTYASLNAAVQALGTEVFTPAPVVSVGALIGYIVVTRTATDLTNPTHAVFVRFEP